MLTSKLARRDRRAGERAYLYPLLNDGDGHKTNVIHVVALKELVDFCLSHEGHAVVLLNYLGVSVLQNEFQLVLCRLVEHHRNQFL